MREIRSKLNEAKSSSKRFRSQLEYSVLQDPQHKTDLSTALNLKTRGLKLLTHKLSRILNDEHF